MTEVKDIPLQVADVEFGGLDGSLGFLVKIAQIHVYERFFEVLAKHDLRLGAVSALILIDRNPGIRHGVLAEALHIKLAHMSKLIKTFERQGYVERRNPDYDRRSVKLMLTPSGRRFVEEMRPILFEDDESQLNSLTASERKELKTLLGKFVGL